MTLPRDGKARVPTGFEGAFSEFRTIPNVGPATAEDLVRLGVRSVKDLARRDPLKMYGAICALDGVRHDPCVIDVFMAALEYAKTGACKPWWKYTPERKAMLANTAGETGEKAKRRVSRSKR